MFGCIFGLSDAIMGLIILAVGNSLTDLVVNMTVAVFTPIMGFSACFGGPMLNILFGIGISVSYIIHTTGPPYDLDFSTTLLVSTVRAPRAARLYALICAVQQLPTDLPLGRVPHGLLRRRHGGQHPRRTDQVEEKG